MALGKGILCDSVVISYMAKCGEIHQPSIFCNSVVNSDLAISGHPTVHRVLFCAILCHIFSIVPHHVTSCDIVPYLAYCAISFHVVPFHFIFCFDEKNKMAVYTSRAGGGRGAFYFFPTSSACWVLFSYRIRSCLSRKKWIFA